MSSSPRVSFSCIFVIDVPPKIWRPKPLTRYVPIDYDVAIDEGVFGLSHYENTVFWPGVRWVDKKRDDIVIFYESEDMEELK